MLYLVTALYCEASPFLELLQFKKNNQYKYFQVFCSENISLIITGVGAVSAAAATAYLLSMMEPADGDLLINFGCCGASDIDIETIVLGNKLIDSSTNRCFYPDILVPHNFLEKTITTVPNPVNECDEHPWPGCYDMEASAIYQAASCFLRPDQLLFVKVVTDHGIPAELNFSNLNKFLKSAAEILLNSLEILQRKNNQSLYVLSHNSCNNTILTTEEEANVSLLSEQMKLSVTMYYELRQILIYWKLQYGEITEKIEHIKRDLTMLSCKTKAEGKHYLGKLKSELFV